MKHQVLIISNPEDEHVPDVVRRLEHYGAQVILFWPEELGNSASLSFQFPDRSAVPRICLQVDTNRYDFNDFGAIWFRRPRLPSLNGYTLSQEGLEFARDEWKTLLHSAYGLIRNPLWVSHPDALSQASNKIRQLTMAHEIGLRVPQTLITNNPDLAREFIAEYNHHVVAKATGTGWVYNEGGHDVTYVLTNRLSQADLAGLQEIRVSPVTFQEEIPKAFEVRANIVGSRCLAIRIESQRSEISSVDWRRYDVMNTPYLPHQLPVDIEAKCLRLCQMLGLEFGAIDLICTPDGAYVFLEVNANGQFLWAEQLSGVRVSDAIARLLAGIAQPLKDTTITRGENTHERT